MDQLQTYLKHVPEVPACDQCIADNPDLYRVAVDILGNDPNANLLAYWSEAEAVSYIDKKIG